MQLNSTFTERSGIGNAVGSQIIYADAERVSYACFCVFTLPRHFFYILPIFIALMFFAWGIRNAACRLQRSTSFTAKLYVCARCSPKLLHETCACVISFDSFLQYAQYHKNPNYIEVEAEHGRKKEN